MAAQEICYELRALVENHCSRSKDNAFLEASLLHGRNLIEFLLGRPKGRHRSDMAPDDFAGNWQPQPGPAVERLRDRLDGIDKHLAHLSWERVDWIKGSGAQYWNYPEMADDVLAVFVAFAEQTKGTAAGDLFATETEVCRRKLDCFRRDQGRIV